MVKRQHAIALICFVASGFSGLVLEVTWIRKSSLVLGSTTFAVGTVVAIFLAGLAIGNHIFGKISSKASKPLQLYGLLEIGVGILAFLSPIGFDLIESVYGFLYREMAEHVPALSITRALLVALVILPPTILMGGSIPLFCRRYVRQNGRIARHTGLLYAANTLGGALGVLTAGLFLLPELGLQMTLAVGAATSLSCGILTASLPISQTPIPAPKVVAPRIRYRTAVYGLFFAVGFTALGAEVLWIRFLGLLVHTTVITYSIVLTVVLVGIVAGSLLASRLVDRTTQRALLFGLLQVLTGLSVLALVSAPADWWLSLPDNLLVYGIALLPSSILSGASFPLAVRMVADEATEASSAAGELLAVNTAGGIAASLIVGLLGIPLFGIQLDFWIISCMCVASGSLAWWLLAPHLSGLSRTWMTLSAFALWLLLVATTQTRLPADYLASREALLDYHEGLGSNLAVLAEQDVLQLEIDRFWQGQDRKNHQVMAAHIPMILHEGNPRRVLVVGVGTGQTASRFLLYPIESLDCVDVEPSLFDFVRLHFDSDWMTDDRVRLVKEDGRHHIQHSVEKYDLISLELGQILRPGIPFFYTEDFYHLVENRLSSRGVVAQFIPLPFLKPDQLKRAIRTFLVVFPESSLWYNTSELLLIGVKGGETRPRAMLTERPQLSEVLRSDLEYSYWGGIEYRLNRLPAFLASFLSGPEDLKRLAGTGPSFTDDRPELDYIAAGVDHSVIEGELSSLTLLRDHLGSLSVFDNLELSEDEQKRALLIREKNLVEIEVSRLVREASDLIPTKDYSSILSLLARAVQLLPEHFVATRMLGEALMDVGRFEEASRFLRPAAEMMPQNGAVRYAFGTALHQAGSIDEAQQQYREALKIRPDHAETHNNLGIVLASTGDLAEAQKHFEEALRLKPGFADALRNLQRLSAMPAMPSGDRPSR